MSSPRHEILHNIDPLLIAPLSFDDMTPIDDWIWTQELTQRILSVPRYDRFNETMQAALRVGDWKIQTGLGGTYDTLHGTRDNLIGQFLYHV